MTPCRCGWTEGPHLCHHCHAAEGERRLYAMPAPFSLTGMQMKLPVRESHLCADCHAHNVAELARVNEASP